MKIFSAILIAGTVIIGFYLYSIQTKAVVISEGECIPGDISTSTEVSDAFRCNDFQVYRCSNNSCGKDKGAMEQGTKWYMCKTTTVTTFDGCNEEIDSSTQRVSGPYGPDQIKPYSEVPDYQVCPPEYNSWSETPPVTECSGSCYPAPKLKALSDNSLLPKNAVDNEGKYKLPINFGWEDNVEKEVIKEPNFCTVGSYEFNIPNPSLTEIVPNTQYNQLVTTSDASYKLECELKPNNDYQWKVRACLDGNAADCGEWSDEQSFSTSLAPEPKSPYDPDWTENNSAAATTPVTLNWCPVEEAEVYKLRINIIEDEKETCHPLLISPEGCKSIFIEKTKIIEGGEEKITLIPEFNDEDSGFFTKITEYVWQIGAYFVKEGTPFEYFSQQWHLKPSGKLADFTLFYPPDDPEEKTPVGLPIVFDWQDKPGTNSFKYKIGPFSGVTRSSQITFDYPDIRLKTAYDWKVEPCWDFEGKQCETDLLKEGHFITTGFPPQLIFPPNNASKVPIPIKLNWNDVPGAKSYVLKIQGEGLNFEKPINNETEFVIAYPDYTPRQETSYTWQVKTCAWKDGKVCGEYSSPYSFRTFKIPPPENLFPANNGQLSTAEKFISWSGIEGIKTYQYKINYLSMSPKELDQTCQELVGQETIKKIVGTRADHSLRCLGQYQWQVQGCLDADCLQGGEWSALKTFNFVEPSGVSKGGLVPCGRLTDNPDTPWNERDSCQIKHLFLFIKIIIDFLLFRLAPIVLVILTLYSGIIFYLSLGRVKTLARVISLWKSVGLGLIITFFAWTMVNIFLKLAGYQIGIFGNWYELPGI